MKKNKKKSLLTKKEKKFFIIMGVILLIIIIIMLLLPVATKNENKNATQNVTNLSRELTTIQEVVEYLEGIYYYEEPSKESGYEVDVYLSFKYNLYEGNESNEIYFKNFYEKIAMVTNFKSFRLIDNSKSITISVKCNEKKISEVLINGEAEYFKNEASRRSKENELNVDTINLDIDSDIINKLIDANWVTSKVNLGSAESQCDKYDIFFDEGYEVRTIQGKVYNIVFTKRYNDPVVEGYKVGDDLKQIEKDLGTSYKNASILGYKTNNFYIYFSTKQISIYPNYKSDYTEFENLVRQYNENKNTNDFLYKLTDIWPDYDTYSTGENFFEIYYTLKGVKISFNSENSDGIQIYENYKGDLKTSKEELKDVYYQLDKNLIIQKEETRQMQTAFYDNSGKEEEPLKYSDKFFVSATSSGENYRDFKIISIDEEYPNNEFEDTTIVYNYIWADDSHLIYTIIGKGMYMYNAETRQTETLLEGDEKFEITNYDRNTNIIEYDGKQSKIEY